MKKGTMPFLVSFHRLTDYNGETLYHVHLRDKGKEIFQERKFFQFQGGKSFFFLTRPHAVGKGGRERGGGVIISGIS